MLILGWSGIRLGGNEPHHPKGYARQFTGDRADRDFLTVGRDLAEAV